LVLADGRAWEQVSPVDKHGGVILSLGDEVVEQASLSGNAFTYLMSASPEAEPQGNTELSQIFALRNAEAGGWSTTDITMPHSVPVGVTAGQGEEYRFFSEDLSVGIVEPFGPFSQPENYIKDESEKKEELVREAFPEATERTPYVRHDSTCQATPTTCYEPLLTKALGYEDVQAGIEFGGNPEKKPVGEANFLAATPDGSHIVLASSLELTSTPTPQGGLYVWSAASPGMERLQLASLLPANEGGMAAEDVVLGGTNPSGFLVARHSISDEGSRIFFSTRDKHQLYMRDMVKGETIRLDVSEGGSRESEGGAVFQTASADGSKAFFTDGPLTKDAGETGEDLYECEIVEVEEVGETKLRCDLSDLTPVPPSGAPGAGETAGVQGAVLGASEDGGYVYFVADGVQAPGARPGDCKDVDEPVGATCSLYVRHDGVTSFIATLSGDDSPDWSVALGEMTSRVSPNGEWLTFMSDRSLTGYDNLDAVSGMPDEEVYLYDAITNKLVCASCDPTGARPVGVEYKNLTGGLVGGDRVWPEGQWLAGNVPGWTLYKLKSAVYQSRYLSNEGRLFFNTSDSLLPQDTNGGEDVYQYEPVGMGGPMGCSTSSVTFSAGYDGCVSLVSSGVAAGESAFVDASGSGGDVFFLTYGRLVTQDTDTSLDVYDAHECTVSAPCPPVIEPGPEECRSATTCRAAPAAQPSIYGAPASATFTGAGNIVPSEAVVKVKSLTRAERLSRALKGCEKDKGERKRTACERSARKRYGPARSSKKTRRTSKVNRTSGVKREVRR
jgi:hypothetical protein